MPLRTIAGEAQVELQAGAAGDIAWQLHAGGGAQRAIELLHNTRTLSTS